MRLLYFFDDHIKKYIMKGKKYCNPTNTGIVGSSIIIVYCLKEDSFMLAKIWKNY